MKKLFAFLVALAALLAPAAANAYWEYGHQTIAEIAYKNVTPETRRAIDALLRQSKLLDTPTCPARTIAEASVWPDCIKKLGVRFNYTFNWHYQDVNVCKPFDLKSACANGNCVSAQIERDMKLLKDKSIPVRERVRALAFLIHFVGDLHQPLHAGEHDDAGANFVHTDYGIYHAKKLNLHSVWDGWLAERAISTPPSLVRRYSPAEKAKLAAGNVTDWSKESWEIARDVVYPSALGGNVCTMDEKHARDAHLTNAAITKLVPIARLEIERGGLRLAKLLDQTFSG